MAWWQEVIELVHQTGQVEAGDGDLAGLVGDRADKDDSDVATMAPMCGAVNLTSVCTPWNRWSRFTESFRIPPSMTRRPLRASAALMVARQVT